MAMRWDDDDRFVVDQYAELDLYLANWNNIPRVDMSLHIILIPSQPVFVFTC